VLRCGSGGILGTGGLSQLRINLNVHSSNLTHSVLPDSIAMWIGYWFKWLATFLAFAATKVATISTDPALQA
jgi:hypothetical protein